jgi:hypothetical protein
MQAIYLLQVFVKLFSKFFILLSFQNPQKPSKNIFTADNKKRWFFFYFFHVAILNPSYYLVLLLIWQIKCSRRRDFYKPIAHELLVRKKVFSLEILFQRRSENR